MTTFGRGKRGPKRDQARHDMVLRLRESGLTLRQIGQQMVPPMTAERVRQIINANKPLDGNAVGA